MLVGGSPHVVMEGPYRTASGNWSASGSVNQKPKDSKARDSGLCGSCLTACNGLCACCSTNSREALLAEDCTGKVKADSGKTAYGGVDTRVVAMRLAAVLLLLFLAPTLWGFIVSMDGNGPIKFSLTAHLKTAGDGEAIYLGPGETYITTSPAKRVKAAIVVLARNQDCDAVVLSMQRLEQRFNHKYNYPYVFLNNQPFDSEFQSKTSRATASRTMYGLIPADEWSLPPWISEADAKAALVDMSRRHVLYGGRESYHHMCRYFSGFFFKHPLLAEFDYYWRMEPDVKYYCDLDYDPFVFMQERSIKYGFVITVYDLNSTIPTLWSTTRQFMDQRPSLLAPNNLLDFVTDGGSEEYNLCHFWSNFEIGDLNFFRSTQYQEYFDHLDQQGGFFFERWGDAPVHSLAAAMFLNHTEVHFFRDIGYRHNSFMHCPARQRNNCDCDALNSVHFHTPAFGACHKRWAELIRRRQ